ncbi:hypothetical protein QCA50_008281 [Cerrena zonata]|uniref:Uncharacterized protein n=1 Tax=Cerrena zonata TaxID=2478898 RepID=A0AAW0GAZ5_9APHY
MLFRSTGKWNYMRVGEDAFGKGRVRDSVGHSVGRLSIRGRDTVGGRLGRRGMHVGDLLWHSGGREGEDVKRQKRPSNDQMQLSSPPIRDRRSSSSACLSFSVGCDDIDDNFNISYSPSLSTLTSPSMVCYEGPVYLSQSPLYHNDLMQSMAFSLALDSPQSSSLHRCMQCGLVHSV